MPSVYVDDARESQYRKGFRVKVGWAKWPQGVVQVGALGPVDSQSPHAADGVSGNGWFIDLDRDGCNDLIRALRKARDDAYGRDQ